MARPRKPWFWKARNVWCVWIDGAQTPLAHGRDNKATAEKEYHRLMADRDEPEDAPKGTVGALAAEFLDWLKNHRSESTHSQVQHFLRSFLRHKRVRELPPHKVSISLVEEWVDSNPGWSRSKRHGIRSLVRMFNWGVRRRKLTRNPIDGIEVPPPNRILAYLTAEQRTTIFKAVKDTAFQLILTALEQTGCRPGELVMLTAEHVDLGQGTWTLPKHKTANKTGKPRVVYLTAGMLDITRELMRENPEGPLFLNSRGNPWNRNSIRIRFRNLRKKFPTFGKFTATSYRRAYVTDALERGVDAVKVAELVGHTSTDMVMRHYSQLQERVKHMREVAERVVG